MTSATVLPSPCISICTIDPATGLCLGCQRTSDEVARWRDMTPDEQRALIAELGERRAKATGRRRRATRRRP